jgi:hypothetical protein
MVISRNADSRFNKTQFQESYLTVRVKCWLLSTGLMWLFLQLWSLNDQLFREEVNVKCECWGSAFVGIKSAVVPGCGPRYLKETDEARNLSSDVNEQILVQHHVTTCLLLECSRLHCVGPRLNTSYTKLYIPSFKLAAASRNQGLYSD